MKAKQNRKPRMLRVAETTTDLKMIEIACVSGNSRRDLCIIRKIREVYCLTLATSCTKNDFAPVVALLICDLNLVIVNVLAR